VEARGTEGTRTTNDRQKARARALSLSFPSFSLPPPPLPPWRSRSPWSSAKPLTSTAPSSSASVVSPSCASAAATSSAPMGRFPALSSGTLVSARPSKKGATGKGGAAGPPAPPPPAAAAAAAEYSGLRARYTTTSGVPKRPPAEADTRSRREAEAGKPSKDARARCSAAWSRVFQTRSPGATRASMARVEAAAGAPADDEDHGEAAGEEEEAPTANWSSTRRAPAAPAAAAAAAFAAAFAAFAAFPSRPGMRSSPPLRPSCAAPPASSTRTPYTGPPGSSSRAWPSSKTTPSPFFTPADGKGPSTTARPFDGSTLRTLPSSRPRCRGARPRTRRWCRGPSRNPGVRPSCAASWPREKTCRRSLSAWAPPAACSAEKPARGASRRSAGGGGEGRRGGGGGGGGGAAVAAAAASACCCCCCCFFVARRLSAVAAGASGTTAAAVEPAAAAALAAALAAFSSSSGTTSPAATRPTHAASTARRYVRVASATYSAPFRRPSILRQDTPARTSCGTWPTPERSCGDSRNRSPPPNSRSFPSTYSA